MERCGACPFGVRGRSGRRLRRLEAFKANRPLSSIMRGYPLRQAVVLWLDSGTAFPRKTFLRGRLSRKKRQLPPVCRRPGGETNSGDPRPGPDIFFPRTEKGGCTSPGKSRRWHAFTCREKCVSIPAGGGKITDAFRRRVFAAYRCGFVPGVAVAPGVARRCRVLCGIVSPLFRLARSSRRGGFFAAARSPACLVAWPRRGSCRGLRHAFDFQRALRGIRPRYRTPPVARRSAGDARLAFRRTTDGREALHSCAAAAKRPSHRDAGERLRSGLLCRRAIPPRAKALYYNAPYVAQGARSPGRGRGGRCPAWFGPKTPRKGGVGGECLCSGGCSGFGCVVDSGGRGLCFVLTPLMGDILAFGDPSSFGAQELFRRSQRASYRPGG